MTTVHEVRNQVQNLNKMSVLPTELLLIVAQHLYIADCRSFSCAYPAARKLFLRKFSPMEVKTRNKGLYWLLFFISTAVLIFAIATHWPWLTLIMPFVFTFFVLAMGIV